MVIDFKLVAWYRETCVVADKLLVTPVWELNFSIRHSYCNRTLNNDDVNIRVMGHPISMSPL